MRIVVILACALLTILSFSGCDGCVRRTASASRPSPPAEFPAPRPTPVALIPAVPGYHWVNGYTRKNGKYVEGHYQTNPDGDKSNNWSTKGNVNPFTGKRGTK